MADDINRLEDEEETTPTLAELAAEPQSVSGDQGSLTNRSLRDMIDADKYDNNKKLGNKAIRQLYGQRYIPPSARGY